MAEMTKLLTLRSVRIAWVLVPVSSILAAWSQASVVGEALRAADPALAPGTTPEAVGFEWIALAQIGMIVIGVVSAGHEYTSGQISTSLLAAPRRWRLFMAKLSALAAVAAVVGLVTVPAVSLVSQLGLGSLSVIGDGLPSTLLLRWGGAVAYGVAVALLSFSVAILMRQTLIPLFGLLVVSQLSLLLLILGPALAYLPTIAGTQLFDPGLTASYPYAALPVPLAAAVTAAWTLVLLVIAGIRFVRRDP